MSENGNDRIACLLSLFIAVALIYYFFKLVFWLFANALSILKIWFFLKIVLPCFAFLIVLIIGVAISFNNG